MTGEHVLDPMHRDPDLNAVQEPTGSQTFISVTNEQPVYLQAPPTEQKGITVNTQIMLTVYVTNDKCLNIVILVTITHVTYHADVKGFYGEDIGLSGLKIVSQVVIGDDQKHLVGVAFLSIQLHEYLRIRAGAVYTARLYSNVITDSWNAHIYIQTCILFVFPPCLCVCVAVDSLNNRCPSSVGTNSLTICPSSSLRSNHLKERERKK